MRDVLMLTGPTATGKSDIGMEVARSLNGRIISADSRSVYRELSIGAGKPTVGATSVMIEETADGLMTVIDGVGHYLIDVVTLEVRYTAADFVRDATRIIDALHSQGVLPIVVGGTGLYIEALRQGYRFAPKTSTQLDARTHQERLRALDRLDPITAHRVDRHNPARVARALAVTEETGQSFFASQARARQPYRFHTYVLSPARAELYRRIDERLDRRIGEGLIDEVRGLIESGYEDRLRSLGLEYRYLTEYLCDGTESSERLTLSTSRLKSAIHAFARRQLTWWRKRQGVVWVDSGDALLRDVRARFPL